VKPINNKNDESRIEPEHLSNTQEYLPELIEKKWQKIWKETKLFSPDMDKSEKPFYNLMMFPYPSAEGMHVGNMYAFSGADVYARFKRMQGYDVFEPFGLDGFGIHSENYSLKIGRHPMEQAEISMKNFYRQIELTGISIDWSRLVETYDPLYYKWTQYLFIKLFKAGLAHRKKAQVNWCPSCKTVLSDEQVISGECERCSSVVEKKGLEQWFFKITNYAQRLLDNLEKLDWTEKVKVAQHQWIGRSEGATINLILENTNNVIEVFTTRPDTLYGVTFLALSVNHPLAQSIQEGKIKEVVEQDKVVEFIKEVKSKTPDFSNDSSKDKLGIFTGLYAINPINQERVPIWVTNYVLSDYGTGAIMGVPAHDERDLDFAKKYNLSIREVIDKSSNKIINSSKWNDLDSTNSLSTILDVLEKENIGKREVRYHLRDWLISRQRYWGAPIPMIFCEYCKNQGVGERDDMPGWYCEDEEKLPVKLLYIEDYKPMGTGKAPLANYPSFYKTTCPKCGNKARRETDVSDTFLDSAWYFLRYTSTEKDIIFDKNRIKKWLPVSIYIGGAEHSVLHLLYSRFMTMALKDLGFIDFEEPFTRFYAHGLIIKEGAKMSKSKGNIIVPDEYIAKFGADTLRMYLMFLGPFSQGGNFRDNGITGMHRFIKRLWNLFLQHIDSKATITVESNKKMHETIKRVTVNLEGLHYNTAISSLMEWYKYLNTQPSISRLELEILVKLLVPFAPHLAEEVWYRLNSAKLDTKEAKWSIHQQSWPVYDNQYLIKDVSLVVIQVNGKRRGEIEVPKTSLDDKEHLQKLAEEQTKRYLVGKNIKDVVYVPGKILNFVV